jgi:hypothetical protein
MGSHPTALASQGIQGTTAQGPSQPLVDELRQRIQTLEMERERAVLEACVVLLILAVAVAMMTMMMMLTMMLICLLSLFFL